MEKETEEKLKAAGAEVERLKAKLRDLGHSEKDGV